MPFLICKNCKHKYLTRWDDTYGQWKLCYSCVKISNCTCPWYGVSERCKRHYSIERDRRENAYWYTGKGWHLIKYSVTNKCKIINNNLEIVGEDVCTLKKAAIKCLIDNNVRVENSDEEYYYKRVINNFRTSY